MPASQRVPSGNQRRLPPLLLLLLLLAASALALAACTAPTPPGGVTSPSTLAGGDSIEWRGRLDCADCASIDARLQLQRNGATRDYVLTEVYFAADGNARFVERGQWQQDDSLLELRGADGARRVYALLQDGRLQSLDRHGQPLPGSEADVLLPVSATSMP